MWLLSFFRWFCNPDFVEDIEGDLLERFERNVEEKGPGLGKWGLLVDVIKLLRPGIIRPLTTFFYFNQLAMFKNNLKISLRILTRHKTYVSINLLGMGFALACCIVSFLNLDYKLRFDEHHRELTQNVYRVNTVRVTEKGKEFWGLSPISLAHMMTTEVSGVEEVIRLHNSNGLVIANDKTFSEKIHYADLSLLQAFNFPLLYGNSLAFNDVNTVVLSEHMALKFFGDANPIGQTLTLLNESDHEQVFVVKAVVKNIPENTSIVFDILIPFNYLIEKSHLSGLDWRDPSQITIFVATSSQQSIKHIDGQIEKYVTVHNKFRDDFEVAGFYLQPFEDLAFSSDVDLPGWVQGRALNRNPIGFLVGITTILSLIILFTACFNFTNTTIAFSSYRLKEIGIRKVIGGGRMQLIGQMMVENMVICVLSIAVGLIGAKYLIDGYNGMFEQHLDMRYIFKSRVIIFMICLPLLAAILAGTYPAFRITKYQPVAILKGTSRFINIGRISKALLIAQFSFSCFALIGTIILTKNANYQFDLDFGYNVHKIAVTSINNPAQYNTFSNEIIKHPAIESVAGSIQIVGRSNEIKVKRNAVDEPSAVRQLAVGPGYLETAGITLTAGRDFINGSSHDLEQGVIINQKLADKLGITSPLNKELIIGDNTYQIVGLVENHLEFGLLAEAPPCLFTAASVDDYDYVSVATSAEKLWDITGFLQDKWFKVNPNQAYSGFVQQMLLFKQFKINEILRNFALLLATATLIMSAAGFFSIVSLSVLKRTKEIGVRKVFGASVPQLIKLLVKDFAIYIFIAFVIGSLMAFALIDNILFAKFYTYHIPFGISIYGFAFFIMLLIPAITIGYKVFTAARAEPAKILNHD